MKNLSDNWEELRLKVLGLGDSSVRKTHYPSLRKRLAELEQIRSKLQQSEAYLLGTRSRPNYAARDRVVDWGRSDGIGLASRAAWWQLVR